MAEPRCISLCPPRNPGGQAKDRRWTLVVRRQYGAYHYDLFGTTWDDPEGAQKAANDRLGQEYTWTARGPAFRAELEQNNA